MGRLAGVGQFGVDVAQAGVQEPVAFGAELLELGEGPELAEALLRVVEAVAGHVAPRVEEEAARLVASKLLGAPVAGPVTNQ
jgi:hypothetical protein